MKAIEETALMKRCPQFDTCSAVECPLDPYQGERGPVEDEKCHALIKTRLRIIEEARAEGIKTPLKYRGLTIAERKKQRRKAAAKARYEALSDEEKKKILSNLRPGRK